MYTDLSSLSQEETEIVRTALSGLIETLKTRRRIGQSTGLVVEEEAVLGSLLHPERGDVTITLVKSRVKEIFISNKRDAGNPFSLMDKTGERAFPGRRLVNNFWGELKDGQYALFLTTQQDHEMLASPKTNRIDIFSTHFNVRESMNQVVESPLKNKPIADCSCDEKWQIYKLNYDMDLRRPIIEKELFAFTFDYAKYKLPRKTETIMFVPDKYRPNLGMLVRDMYPYGVRQMLRRDFPAEHKAKLEEVYGYLRSLAAVIIERQSKCESEPYQHFLQEILTIINNTLQQDPELTAFT